MFEAYYERSKKKYIEDDDVCILIDFSLILSSQCVLGRISFIVYTCITLMTLDFYFIIHSLKHEKRRKKEVVQIKLWASSKKPHILLQSLSGYKWDEKLFFTFYSTETIYIEEG